jgi:hypothetical protein
MRNILKVGQKHTYEGINALFKNSLILKFWSISMLLDPDPHTVPDLGHTQMNADPDPKHRKNLPLQYNCRKATKIGYKK